MNRYPPRVVLTDRTDAIAHLIQTTSAIAAAINAAADALTAKKALVVIAAPGLRASIKTLSAAIKRLSAALDDAQPSLTDLIPPAA